MNKNFLKGAVVGAFIMCIVGVVIGCSAIDRVKVSEDSILTKDTLNKLEKIQDKIEDEYLYSDDMDSQAIQDAILKGYVAGLNDPYSVYYDEAETKELYEMTSGTFGGIGVAIQQDQTTRLITFTHVYKDNPGDKAGFLQGDVVYKINGEDVSNQDLDTVVSKIRGEIGTEVKITVVRDGEEYTGTAVRALIENDTVSYEMKEGKIGYLQITAFEEVTYKQFVSAMMDLKSQGMKGLVIDLRNNGGGNLITVCQMLDAILPEGNVVSVEYKSGKKEVYPSDENSILDVPLVVLTNGYSASASEIFAGAVQDYKIGTLVGTTTYGKGVVQQVYDLGDNTSVKLTVAEYFTAGGRNIHGIGITPDVVVEYEYDEENPTSDNQLDKALEILKKGM